MDTKKYVIFNYSDADLVDYTQVYETSKDTLAVSNLGKTFVKYSGSIPSSVDSLPNRSNVLTHTQIKLILKEDEWKNLGIQ